ncbi:MAG: DUF1016 domain-containing protein [Muribaculaceae bacterium]|nr:DUF1016 domain-containing protein [Muribaculaceae bacterium]
MSAAAFFLLLILNICIGLVLYGHLSGQTKVHKDQKGELRAEYGSKLLDVLSKELTLELGKGYSYRSLAYYRLLYAYFPD